MTIAPFPTFVAFVEATQRRDQHEDPFTLTPAQRVWCRVVVDGINPCDLDTEDRAIALRDFGTDGTIPADARDVIALAKGARVGGTLLCTLAVLWLGVTVPFSGAPGERLFCLLVGERTPLGRQALGYIRGAVAKLSWPVVSASADAITLRRADGVEVVFVVLPAARAGSATRGRSLGSALMTEAAFFRDPDTGVVNDSEVYRSMAPRVVRGGKLFIESTVWSDSGLLHDLVESNWGAPTTALACRARTLDWRGDDNKIRRTVEAELARDEPNARREFFLVPLASEGDGWLSPHMVDASLVERPAILDVAANRWVSAGCDLGFTHDASAIVVVVHDAGIARVAEVLELRPVQGIPLLPSSVAKAFSEVCARHGVSQLISDRWSYEPMREHFARHGIRLHPTPADRASRDATFERVRLLVHSGRLELSTAHADLAAQLKSLRRRPLPGGGFAIDAPRTRSGHADSASAFVAACATVAQHADRLGSPRHAALRRADKLDAIGTRLTCGDVRGLEYRRALRWIRGESHGHSVDAELRAAAAARAEERRAAAARAATGAHHHDTGDAPEKDADA